MAYPAIAADPEVEQAQQLVKEGKYQQAYDLLSPLENSSSGDAQLNYLLGRAALGTGQPRKAKALFERSIAAKADFGAAHLGLGRAYVALGQYTQAKIEFETVLRFDNLPPDVLTQVEVYDKAARQALEENKPLSSFGYAEMGIGRYRVNETSGSSASPAETFYNARVGGGLNYALQNGYALDATLDLQYRHYDSETRSDQDLRWQFGGSKSLGENNLSGGLKGRTSYRGNGDYRNDFSLFTDYRMRHDADDQFTLGGELRRRNYPQGPESELSRTTATVSAGWVKSFMEGKGSFSLTGHAGRNYATSRPDGNSSVFGAKGALDFTVNKTLSWGGFVAWERDQFATDNIHLHPDSLDSTVAVRRSDNLYEVGGHLVWKFAPTWSLRPGVLWIRDQSNSIPHNYSSTELWLNLRKEF